MPMRMGAMVALVLASVEFLEGVLDVSLLGGIQECVPSKVTVNAIFDSLGLSSLLANHGYQRHSASIWHARFVILIVWRISKLSHARIKQSDSMGGVVKDRHGG